VDAAELASFMSREMKLELAKANPSCDDQDPIELLVKSIFHILSRISLVVALAGAVSFLSQKWSSSGLKTSDFVEVRVGNEVVDLSSPRTAQVTKESLIEGASARRAERVRLEEEMKEAEEVVAAIERNEREEAEPRTR